MKYTKEIIINAPREKVVELFDNQENAFKWMQGLVSFDHVSGTPGEPGAKSKMLFKMGKREMAMDETIESKHLPDNMTMVYEARGVYNRVVNHFEKVNENTTKYINDQEFKFESWAMKFMGMVMPGAFKKQSEKYMTDFKNFVENEVNSESQKEEA